LGVTRGSIYHHFDSLESFHAAVIAHWSEQSSGRISRAALDIDGPKEALEDLLQTTFRSGEALERAVRAWSTVEPLVATAVEQVDQGRIGIAETLLTRAGVPPSEARPRARLLYWAAIGRLMMPFPGKAILSPPEITGLARLMLQPEADAPSAVRTPER
jgi:AcrR family transcriptional regulator